MESPEEYPLAVIPGLVDGDHQLEIWVLNMSENSVVLGEGHEVAEAYEVDALLDMNGDAETSAEARPEPILYVKDVCMADTDLDGTKPTVCQVKVHEGGVELSHVESAEPTVDPNDSSKNSGCLPDHLVSMFEDAQTCLSLDEAEQLRQVLMKQADAFAKDDFDIGSFKAAVHHIRTGSHFPIQKSMRRTPLGFEGQEKATLDSMLQAGVIKQSQSEWASPPCRCSKKR